jgi:predicted MPP superfamily phosphohydrolase
LALFARLIVGLLAMAAGFYFFIIITSRLLTHIPDETPKGTFVPFLFLSIVGGAGAAGYRFGDTAWAFIPLALAAAIGLYWAWNIRLVRTLRGSPPSQISGQPFSLLRPLTTTQLAVFHYQVRVSGWQGRLRIAHLSDLHVSEKLPMAFYQQAIEHANASKPDLVFITGDFISELESLPLVPQLLTQIESRLGGYAILGNHDFWVGRQEVEEVVGGAGFNLLGSASASIAAQPGRGAIRIEGCEAPWRKRDCQMTPAGPHELLLLLAHTADNIYHLSGFGARAVFSGHFHAGQIRLPWLGPVFVPSRYGRRFSHGHFTVNGCHLFCICRGGRWQPGAASLLPTRYFYRRYPGRGAARGTG